MNFRLRRWDPEKDDADELWGRLNEGWRDLYTLVVGLFPFALRDITFTGPVATLTFGVDTPSRPRAVILASLYRTDTGATSAVTFSWTYSQGEVSTTAFSGLSATEWRATFLVIGGV